MNKKTFDIVPIMLTDKQTFFENDCACATVEKNEVAVREFHKGLYQQIPDVYTDFCQTTFCWLTALMRHRVLVY
jgi:hypothetical protein